MFTPAYVSVSLLTVLCTLKRYLETSPDEMSLLSYDLSLFAWSSSFLFLLFFFPFLFFFFFFPFHLLPSFFILMWGKKYLPNSLPKKEYFPSDEAGIINLSKWNYNGTITVVEFSSVYVSYIYIYIYIYWIIK